MHDFTFTIPHFSCNFLVSDRLSCGFERMLKLNIGISCRVVTIRTGTWSRNLLAVPYYIHPSKRPPRRNRAEVRGDLYAPLPIGGYIHAPGNAWRALPGAWKKTCAINRSRACAWNPWWFDKVDFPGWLSRQSKHILMFYYAKWHPVEHRT